MKEGMNLYTTSIGNSGEYFVAAELERRGFTAAVPMSNTKDFDILKKGNGIAFTLPITSVGGPATLQILSGMNLSGGKI